jgi:hypothetical protein
MADSRLADLAQPQSVLSFRVSNRLAEKILASRRMLVWMDAAKLTAFDAVIAALAQFLL